MSKIVLNNIPNLNEHELGRGAYGRCFLAKDNTVLKLFYTNERDIYQNIERMSHLESPNFAFPKDLVYLKEISDSGFIGYYMDFIEGDHFDVLDGSINLDTFLTSLCKLESEIRRLTFDYGLKIFDIAYDNSFYSSDDDIKIIDTDLYTFSDLPYNQLLSHNFSEVSDLISEYFIRANERRFKSDRLKDYLYDFYDGLINPSAYLYEVIEEIRRESSEEIKDYNSFKNNIKLIMKR